MSPLKSDSSFNISVFDMNGQYVCVERQFLVCVCHCFVKSMDKKRMREADAGWIKSDEPFCIKPATKSTTEAASHFVLTAFRLPNLHMK